MASSMSCVTSSAAPAVHHVHQQVLHLHAGDGVQRREGLIGQQQQRLARHGARQRHPLRHAARELRWAQVAGVRQPHGQQRPLHALLPLGVGQVGLVVKIQTEAHVARHVQPGQQPGLLEQQRRARVRLQQALAEEGQVAVLRLGQAAEHAQQGGFPAATAAQQAHDFPRADLQVNALEHGWRARVGIGQLVGTQHGRDQGGTGARGVVVCHPHARAAPAARSRWRMSSPWSWVRLGVTMGRKAASRQRRAKPSGWSRW